MADKYAELRAALPELIEEARRQGGTNPRAQMIIDLLAERDGLLDQHRRDSKELRRVCAERDAARKTSKAAGDAVAGLRTERGTLREALRWAAGALQAVCDSGAAEEMDWFRLETENRTADEILNMADAALAQGQGGSDGTAL